MLDIASSFPQGYWAVRDLKYINKYDALLEANKTLDYVGYRYFDDVWDKFDRSLIGKSSLSELYKQRAQQLRDKYDYLILYFSGGADSYNVLRSFIDNNIKLDEVCVKWCNDTLKSNSHVYTPNTSDGTANNYLSEWDLAIKPVLDWLSKYHPSTKIEIVDWFKDRTLIGKEDIFKVVNHWHDVEVPTLALWSPSEAKMIDSGKSVGSIYGIDKPQTYFENNCAYFFFSDSAVTMGTPNPINIYGTEYFYWSPDFPVLAFEMANKAASLYLTSQDLIDNVSFNDSYRNRPLGDFFRARQTQQSMLRHVLYDNWTDSFQAGKPLNPDRSDKHFWLYKYDELAKVKDSYVDMSKLHTSALNSKYVYSYNGSTMYRPLYSKKHLLFKYDSNLERIIKT